MKRICFLLILFCLTACTKEVDFTGAQSDPLLVVNGLQQVGQPAWLRVEKSTFFLDNQPDCRVKDVTVDLYVNGLFKEHLQVCDSLEMQEYSVWTEEGEVLKQRLKYAFNYCEGQYVLCAGDQLRFEVHSSEFEDTAVAETILPEAPTVISFDTVRVEMVGDHERKVRFALILDDPVGADYYNLYPQDGLTGFTSSDPVFTDLTAVEDIEGLFGDNEYYGRGLYNMFNDRFFDGSRYSLSMEIHVYDYGGWDKDFSEPFTLEVTRLDAHFYQYLKSYRVYSSNSVSSLIGMFTEPVQVYSNVRNAIGVVGSQSLPVTKTIDLGGDLY